MSINPSTGVITAAPNQIGNFVFAVRVEEYRNGVKLGESRRELQYASLPCTVNNVPQIETPDTVFAFVNGDSTCIDVRTYDSDNSVDLYLQINSNDFDIKGSIIVRGLYLREAYNYEKSPSINIFQKFLCVVDGREKTDFWL